jgi:hypothetical protein
VITKTVKISKGKDTYFHIAFLKVNILSKPMKINSKVSNHMICILVLYVIHVITWVRMCSLKIMKRKEEEGD